MCHGGQPGSDHDERAIDIREKGQYVIAAEYRRQVQQHNAGAEISWSCIIAARADWLWSNSAGKLMPVCWRSPQGYLHSAQRRPRWLLPPRKAAVGRAISGPRMALIRGRRKSRSKRFPTRQSCRLAMLKAKFTATTDFPHPGSGEVMSTVVQLLSLSDLKTLVRKTSKLACSGSLRAKVTMRP